MHRYIKPLCGFITTWADSWQSVSDRNVLPGAYLICTSYFWMRSIILAMQGGVLDRCFLKIAYSRIPQQRAGHRHSIGTFPSQTGQLVFPSQCWSNNFLLRSTTCWQTPLDHWLVGKQHLDPSRWESTWMVTGWVPSKYCNEVGAVIAFLMWPTADWCSGLQTNSLVFLVSTQRLAAMDAKSGIKRLRNWTIPRKVCRFARLVDRVHR